MTKKKKKKNKVSHKKIIIITLIAIVIIAIIAGCFTPTTKSTQIGTDYEVSNFIFAKRLYVKKDWDCYYSQKCPVFSSHEVDAMMISNGECLSDGFGSEKCYTFYISRSGSMYYSAEEAYYDRYNKNNPSVGVSYYGEGDERKPSIASWEISKCYIYGLYCPNNSDNKHIGTGLATGRRQQATIYNYSNCYIEPNDDQGSYYERCSYGNSQTANVDRAIFRYSY